MNGLNKIRAKIKAGTINTSVFTIVCSSYFVQMNLRQADTLKKKANTNPVIFQD